MEVQDDDKSPSRVLPLKRQFLQPRSHRLPSQQEEPADPVQNIHRSDILLTFRYGLNFDFILLSQPGHNLLEMLSGLAVGLVQKEADFQHVFFLSTTQLPCV